MTFGFKPKTINRLKSDKPGLTPQQAFAEIAKQ
jgi:hypothetical protein